MLKVYTGNKEILKSIKVDYAFPETQLSYKEQFEWIRSHYKENISIFTYSRCIFDYLDVLVKNSVLTKQNSSILYIDDNLNHLDLIERDDSSIFQYRIIDDEAFYPEMDLLEHRCGFDKDIKWLL